MELKPSGGVLGIDASTNTLAFCYMSESGAPEWWGEFDIGRGTDIYNRLATAYTNMEHILDTLLKDTKGARCYIESAVKINNIKTTINLSYMYGIIIGAAGARGMRVHEVSPITWQNYIGNKSLSKSERESFADLYRGKSSATIKNKIREFRKKRTIDWVNRYFDIELESDNVADAVGVSWYGIHH